MSAGRLPNPRSSELSDKADWLTAGKKQGAQSYKDPDWGHLRAPDLGWGRRGLWANEGKENSKAARGGGLLKGAEG